jgi:endoglucanase
MEKNHFFIILSILTTVLAQNLGAQETRTWFQDGPFRFPKANPKAKALSLIKVEGNKFMNSEGKIILFRGISISDPDKIERQGHWNKNHFEKVKKLSCLKNM